MFLAFGVKNYKSIKDEQEFSFVASKTVKEHSKSVFQTDDNEKILKTCLIYGRNASGKSNILEALSDFLTMITTSTDLKLNKPIPSYKPFLFDEESKKSNSKFWLEIIAENSIKYYYEVIFNREEIVKEVLDFYPKGYPANLFKRKGKKFKYGDYLKGEKRSIENQVLKNQLYLAKAVINNHSQLKTPFLTIAKAFPAININSSHDDHVMGIFMDAANTGEDRPLLSLLHNINEFLKIADTGILKIEPEIRENKIDSYKLENVPDDNIERLSKDFEDRSSKYNIKSYHKSYHNKKETGVQHLPFELESQGSKRLAVLGGLAAMSITTGSLLIVDELNNSLHPLLTNFLIKLYHSEKFNKKNAQLLFSTHDTSLLNTDYIRRDQVWFAEKNKYGESSYFSITDFDGVRKETPIEKWYLSGRFGAIPVIDDIDLDLIL